MAMTCRAAEQEAVDEYEDYFEPQDRRVVSGWQASRADRSSGCIWSS